MEVVGNEGLNGDYFQSRIQGRLEYSLIDDLLRDDDTDCGTGANPESKETENQQT
jgi:hypothetical protein